MDNSDRKLIADEFRNCIDNTLIRLASEDTHRPFHSALLSKQALFWSRLERSFSTSFGQRTIENVSRIAAMSGGASEAGNQKETIVKLSRGELSALENHIMAIRCGTLGRAPSWKADIESIKKAEAGEKESFRVISDLWWVKNDVHHYLSIKTVKPNIDQTAEAKRDLLKLQLNNSECKVFLGLYYNPFGEDKEDYNWTPPMGMFDFHKDPVVLIGRDYWEELGGKGFYDELLVIAKEVGDYTRSRLGTLLCE